MALSPGDKLGPYEILSPIGAGGMGEVYKARDTRLDRTVAIKVLPEHVAKRDDLRARFEREARAVASLNHPHICTLHDIGPGYMVMELIEGETLAARIAKGALQLDQALKFGAQIADGLDRAHLAGVTHRDIKPQNVMITRDGVKLLDFGLAKSTAKPGPTEETLTAVLTTEGTILGTPQYMAPEQFEGKEADVRSDVWAFGAVLYEMATGQKAFQGKSYSSLVGAILSADPPPCAPAWLDRLVRRCLAKDPEERYQSMRDALLDLKAPVVESIASPGKSNKWPWAVAAALAATTALGIWSPWRTPPPAPQLARLQLTLAGKGPLELSPDGRVLSYADQRKIWVRSLDSTETRALQGTENFQGGWFWSADGRFIAFGQDGKLKKIDVRTGVVSAVADNILGPRGGSWNQEGVLIIGSGTGIQKIELARGTITQVTQVDKAKEGDHLFPRFLPDGRHFVYVKQAADFLSGVLAVGSIDLPPEKQAIQALTTTSGGGTRAAVAFVPASLNSSAMLVFSRDQVVLAQQFDPARLSLLGEPAPISEGEVSYFSAAQDVLVSNLTTSRSSKLAIYDRDGRELSMIGERTLQYGLNVSHDGSLVFVLRHTNTRNIWALDLKRGTQAKITSDAILAYGGIVSPDGKSVVFASRRSAGRAAALYWKAANGAGEERVLLQDAGFAQSWSRDGKFILYASNNASTDKTAPNLMLLPMEGGTPGKPYPYLATSAREIQGKFSPDGNWVAYVSDESGSNQVFVSSFPDPSKSKIPIAVGNLPRWSRDGNELFYFAPDDTLMSVRFSPAGGIFRPEKPKPLFKVPLHRVFGTDTSGTGWDTVPGGRFLINVDDTPAEETPLNVVLNWRLGIK